MSGIRVNSQNAITVDQQRTRQTPRTAVRFSNVLKGGANVLLQGAATATQMVGMPSLSAAISRVNADNSQSTDLSIAGASQNGQSNTVEDAQQLLQQQQREDDIKLLKLQSEIQSYNRQITLVSNVMKSRHETAKSAINNIRS